MGTVQQSEQRKLLFLDAFRETGIIRAACEATGVSRTMVYEWKAVDPAFEEAFIQAELESTELLEREALRRAKDGVTKRKGVYYEGKLVGEDIVQDYSDTLAIFLLKARAPEKYRERQDLNIQGEITVIPWGPKEVGG